MRRLGILATLLLVVAGCTSGSTDKTADGEGGELGATRWVLQSMVSDGALTIVPDGLYADAQFMSLRVKGFSGCNDYDAVYRTGGRTLLITDAVSTRLACPEPALTFESTYLGLLEQSRFFNVRSDTLTIRGADASILLVFLAAPSNPLLGSWVVDSYASAPNTLSAPLPDSNMTAVFGLSKVAGFTGCNSYTGPYTTNGSVAAIGPLATTRAACADDLMTQETAYLAALSGVARVEPRGATLQLQDRNGAAVVILARPVTPEPSPSPSASASPSAPPSASPSAPPSATPTAAPSPTPTPTATPTAAPTATPAPTATAAPTGTPAPTVKPPPSLPPLASCTVVNATTNAPLATVKYPASWHTVAAPPNLACRYFDPAAITVPADPTTLVTAVMIKYDATTTYTDALTAATNPTAWNVSVNQPATVGGLPATRLEATSTAGSDSVPVGQTRYGYLIDAGGQAVWIETIGTVGSATYNTNVQVVNLIASQVTITPPAP
jgi:heat shock protein HslJ